MSITGYGLVEQTTHGLSLVDMGIVRTKPKHSLPARLATIYQDILQIVEKSKPDCLILEKLYVHYRHPTTAHILGQARGIICLISVKAHLPLFEYAATRVKKAIVGQGLASKAQVQRMVTTILGLRQLPKYQDITDALALAIAHSYINKTKSQLNVQGQKKS